jgi:hypothetical protein
MADESNEDLHQFLSKIDDIRKRIKLFLIFLMSFFLKY